MLVKLSLKPRKKYINVTKTDLLKVEELRLWLTQCFSFISSNTSLLCRLRIECLTEREREGGGGCS